MIKGKVKIERKKHFLDAAGKPLGRLASEIAGFLQGKHKPEYMPNIDLGDFVEVTNIKNVVFTGSKFKNKVYRHHTGYAGGLKVIPLKKLFVERPDEVLKKAVFQMLPKNKLANERIKRLIIKD